MSRRRTRGLVNRRLAGASALLALAWACVPPIAEAADPLRITDLQVEGGEGRWHSSNVFRLDWTQVPGPPAFPRAVVYRLFDSAGRLVLGPVRNTKVATAIDSLSVPARPDAYRIELRLEDDEGRAGPAAEATLRFDDAAPQPPTPLAPPGWQNSREAVLLRIARPEPPLPISGLRGYAVALDQGSGGSPCAEPRWCSVSETDLTAGFADASLPIGPLPEGTTEARVVAVSGSGVASTVAAVSIRVDGSAPQVSLSGLPSGWSPAPVRLSVVATDPLSGMAGVGVGVDGPYAAVAVDGGAPALGPGHSVSTWVTGNGLHQIAYFARDAAGNVGDGITGAGPATAVVAIDEEPPRVAFAAAQDPDEPERIEARVADAVSGPSPTRGAIRLRRSGSDMAFAALPTRILGDRLVATWDSDSYPPGKYEFLATAYDLAGNTATGSDRARGAQMVLVNPLKARVSLQAGFADGRTGRRCKRSPRGRRCRLPAIAVDARPAALTVPFGRGVRFQGRMESLTGLPMRGLEVTVTETYAEGSDPRRRTTPVRTEVDGSFSVQLPPGPSRRVEAAFAGTRTLTRATSESLRLDVLAGVHLRVSAATARIGGPPVVFRGSVDPAGATDSAGGLPVELQFRYPGAEWAEFRTVETDARGRFRYAYRFSDDDSRGIRFGFRARMPDREGWPYEPAFSDPVAVSGR